MSVNDCGDSKTGQKTTSAVIQADAAIATTLSGLDTANLWFRVIRQERKQSGELPWWAFLERRAADRRIARFEQLAIDAMCEAARDAGRRSVGACGRCNEPVAASDDYTSIDSALEVQRKYPGTPAAARPYLVAAARFVSKMRVLRGPLHATCAAEIAGKAAA